MEEWKMIPPLRSEVEAALNQLGNGKSPGIDDIPAEMWKATGEEGIDLLWHLCLLMEEWKTEGQSLPPTLKLASVRGNIFGSSAETSSLLINTLAKNHLI